MAMARDPHAAIPVHFGKTCDICTESYQKLKLLNCGHEFCQTCIEKWARKTPREDGYTIECPNDRTATSTTNIDGLKNRYYGALLCAYCEESWPVAKLRWCTKCLKLMCSDCVLDVHMSLVDHPKPELWSSMKALKQVHSYFTEKRVKTDATKIRQRLEPYFVKLLEETTCQMLGKLSKRGEDTMVEALKEIYGFDDEYVSITYDAAEYEVERKLRKVAMQAFTLAELDGTGLLTETDSSNHVEEALQRLLSIAPREAVRLLLQKSDEISLLSRKKPTAPPLEEATRNVETIRPKSSNPVESQKESLYYKYTTNNQVLSAQTPSHAGELVFSYTKLYFNLV